MRIISLSAWCGNRRIVRLSAGDGHWRTVTGLRQVRWVYPAGVHDGELRCRKVVVAELWVSGSMM